MLGRGWNLWKDWSDVLPETWVITEVGSLATRTTSEDVRLLALAFTPFDDEVFVAAEVYPGLQVPVVQKYLTVVGIDTLSHLGHPQLV